MQEYSVIVTETAKLDIDDCLDFIAQDSVENAVNWYHTIYKKMATLSALPFRCPIADENPYCEFEVRCLLIGDYRVIYRIDDETVEVLHVRHSAKKRKF